MTAGPAPADDGGLGAFVDYPALPKAYAADGPLAGLTLGVKDIIDVGRYPTGCGQPLKRAQSAAAPPTRDASVVAKLLGAGARFVAKTHTDELAYSIIGENAHYGTPANPAAPGRVPGGSSSGSASATAGGAVDIGLGSDTGGSVRVPASFCGLFGIRTTHGMIALDGFMPLAPSFDTAGWFSRDAATFARVGEVLLPQVTGPRRLLIADDAFGGLEPGVMAAFTPVLARIEAAFPGTRHVRLLDEGGFETAYEAFRIHQAFEIWQSHGRWISEFHPDFGPGIKERFAFASTVTKADFQIAATRRAAVADRMLRLAAADTAVIVPTAVNVAPLRDSPPAVLDTFRSQSIAILALAGLSRLPQVSVPGITLNGLPIGLGIIGARGMDQGLIALAAEIAPLLSPVS